MHSLVLAPITEAVHISNSAFGEGRNVTFGYESSHVVAPVMKTFTVFVSLQLF